MKKNYILFIDSGLGGLSTLSETIKLLPYNYLYYADNIHCPYGSFTQQEIFEFLNKIILNLKNKYKFKTIVLACNTATTSAIKKLREKYPNINFIGTEPAISIPKKLGYKRTLCIATPATLRQRKYKELSQSHKIEIKNLPLSTFANSIENYLIYDNISSRLDVIKNIYYIISKLENCDSIVLGCTHYVLIKEKLKKYFSIPLFDGNEGVARMIKKSVYSKKKEKTSIKIILSNNKNNIKQKYIKILKQILAKDLKIC